jgi:hypothetical protein
MPIEVLPYLQASREVLGISRGIYVVDEEAEFWERIVSGGDSVTFGAD